MADWSQAQQLPPDTLTRIYGQTFPLEVRHCLAEWIEAKPWNDLNVNNPSHETYATQLLEEMLKLIEDKSNSLGAGDFLLKIKLDEAFTQFTNRYTANPLNLVRVVKTCLDKERQALQQPNNVHTNGELASQTASHRDILDKLERLERCTIETENDLRILQEKQESFVIQYQDIVKIKAQLQQLQNQQPNNQQRDQQLQVQKDQLNTQLSHRAQELRSLRLMFVKKHEQCFNVLREAQAKVIHEELNDWKRRQQLAGNGVPFDNNLDHLQQWCVSLADILWNNRQQLQKLEMLRAQLPIDLPEGQVDLVPQLERSITGLLSALVTSTFIVEHQPPQVLKKEARFTSTVRLLVGGKLNVHMNPLKVEASIISENQARLVEENDRSKSGDIEECGKILNNSGTMEHQQSTGQFSITFRNMQLKTIKRAERRGSEVHAVTEEKFSILFRSSFDLGGGELLFHVWTLSLPVVVTVHGNQECNATATVMWDNAFSKQGRTLFQVDEKIQWHRLAEMLRSKFKSFVGVDLTAENLNYLASKVFGGNVMEDFSNRYIAWTQFNKEPINARAFTFWEWFYAILKLSKEHLKNPWMDGSIVGFIGKAQAQERLMSKENGTFLLRFSDSEIGGITIAWVDSKPGDSRQVWNLAPFTARDFAIRSLADRIKDLPNLVYLYPDTPKDGAFSKYYTQATVESDLRGGYVRSKLVSKIEVIDIFHNQCSVSPMSPEPVRMPQPMGAQSPNSEYATSFSVQSDLDMDSQSFILTDYNPEDIDKINVNELLMRSNLEMQDVDFGTMMHE